MSDESNDVTKALAAFGAPSIRYHSFGQAQTKPSSLTLPRNPAEPVLPPIQAAVPETMVIEQAEPVAAPEVPVSRAMPPPASMPPRPSPLFPPGPMTTVAPPPRPLAEWAAPVNLAPPRPAPPPAPPTPSPVMPLPDYAAVPPPLPPAPMPRPAPALVAAPPPPHVPPPPADTVVTSRIATLGPSSSLPEIFEFLAAS